MYWSYLPLTKCIQVSNQFAFQNLSWSLLVCVLCPFCGWEAMRLSKATQPGTDKPLLADHAVHGFIMSLEGGCGNSSHKLQCTCLAQYCARFGVEIFSPSLHIYWLSFSSESYVGPVRSGSSVYHLNVVTAFCWSQLTRWWISRKTEGECG